MPRPMPNRIAFLVLLALVGTVGAITSCTPPPQVEETDETMVTESDDGFKDEQAVPSLGGDELLPHWAGLIRDPSALKAPFVFIKITQTSSTPTWLLAPKVVGICKTPKIDCESVVTWRWLPPMANNVSIHIEAKVDQPNCFDPIDLHDSVPVSVNVNPDDTECPPGTIWEYAVTCIGAGDETCPPPLDPQVHIQD